MRVSPEPAAVARLGCCKLLLRAGSAKLWHCTYTGAVTSCGPPLTLCNDVAPGPPDTAPGPAYDRRLLTEPGKAVAEPSATPGALHLVELVPAAAGIPRGVACPLLVSEMLRLMLCLWRTLCCWKVLSRSAADQ